MVLHFLFTFRCSLINLEETQDEELDAILGELSVLESQFEEELESKKSESGSVKGAAVPLVNKAKPAVPTVPIVPLAATKPQVSPTSDGPKIQSNRQLRPALVNGKRTESPDTDSAFCDNVSVLSSCSTSSGARSNATDAAKSSSGMSSTNSTSPTTTSSQEDQEAKIKAEKIKLAIEKIKEANVKKLFIKVFTSDGSAKSLLVDEKMTVNHVTRILAEKNHVKLDPKWTLVELIPDLYMERVYEDHENLVENCLMWKVDSKNTLWFIERPEKYDVFVRPERYLLGTSSSQRGDTMEDHARQELLEEYFSSTGVGAPEMEGFLWLKADSKKSWKKFFFVLRTSGLYYAPKGKKTSRDLVCLATFDVNQVYYGSHWQKKYKSPTDFCFAIKHPQIQVKTAKHIRYLCADTEKELHQWVTGIRVAKNGKQLYGNYRGIEDEITHADIDILTSKRYSVNSPNTLQINGGSTAGSSQSKAGTVSPARTPSSENKSLDSALSSGIVSDVSNSNDVIPAAHAVDELTPVNTMERPSAGAHAGNLRRSASKASNASSSSSGCQSDSRCSSSTGSLQQPQQRSNGFESDHPMGGTIKKRPSAIANPKLPLTNTTFGLVRDSDDDTSSLGSGDNIRIGGGGTLLRNAVRQSLRRNSKPQIYDTVQPQQPKQQIQVEIHHQDNNSDALSQGCEAALNSMAAADEEIPLPPPPRAESMHQNIDTVTCLPEDNIDDLPPPPPEMYESNNHHPQLQMQMVNQKKPAPPPPPPASSKPGKSPGKPTKRISFDDNVQLIGVSEPEPGEHHIFTFNRPQYVANPKKLFSSESKNKAVPPQSFLTDLQKVITKKWAICK